LAILKRFLRKVNPGTGFDCPVSMPEIAQPLALFAASSG